MIILQSDPSDLVLGALPLESSNESLPFLKITSTHNSLFCNEQVLFVLRSKLIIDVICIYLHPQGILWPLQILLLWIEYTWIYTTTVFMEQNIINVTYYIECVFVIFSNCEWYTNMSKLYECCLYALLFPLTLKFCFFFFLFYSTSRNKKPLKAC